MSNYLRRMSFCLAMAGLLLGFAAADAAAAVITSADFSFGFGAYWSTNPATWSDYETSTTNTPTTQGDFTFAPAPVGNYISTRGCSYYLRELKSQIGNSKKTGYLLNFEVPIAASYTGAAPADADPTTPNYSLQIEITKISIYGCNYRDHLPATMAWDETTTGHEQTSPSIDLITTDAIDVSTSYTQLVWNPGDYGLSLASLNDSATRTFDILPTLVNEVLDYHRCLEGMEIEGRVRLLYNMTALLPGDADYSGVVDEDDAAILAANWLREDVTSWGEGDFNGDGKVDEIDATLMATNWGRDSTVGAGAGSVPEPAAWALLLSLLPAAGMLRRKGIAAK